MRLEPLYRVEFTYPEGWSIELAGEHGTQWQDFYLAEGTCTGRIVGRMRGANHPRRRTDGTFGPDFQGVIDILRMKFIRRDPTDKTNVKYDLVDIPASHAAEAAKYREQLLEVASHADDVVDLQRSIAQEALVRLPE